MQKRRVNLGWLAVTGLALGFAYYVYYRGATFFAVIVLGQAGLTLFEAFSPPPKVLRLVLWISFVLGGVLVVWYTELRYPRPD